MRHISQIEMQTFGTPLPGISYTKRIGAYALILNEQGKFASIQFYQGFFLPGGGVDEGETPQDALKRELREELGWEVDKLKEVCEATQFFYTSFKDMHIENIGHFFTATVLHKNAVITEVDHELVWLTAAQAKKKLYHEHQRWEVGQLM